jgi:hypothetical protein
MKLQDQNGTGETDHMSAPPMSVKPNGNVKQTANQIPPEIGTNNNNDMSSLTDH